MNNHRIGNMGFRNYMVGISGLGWLGFLMGEATDGLCGGVHLSKSFAV